MYVCVYFAFLTAFIPFARVCVQGMYVRVRVYVRECERYLSISVCKRALYVCTCERVRVRGSCDRRGSFPAETRAGGGRGGRRGVKAQMPLRHLSRHICRARTANPPMRSATPATDDRPRAIVRERNPRPRAPTRSSIGSPRKVSFCWMSGERHLAA